MKSVQEPTQNLRYRSLSVLTASKSLIYMTKLRITLEFTSQDRLATCIICLNDFNNQEEVIGHMNISPWKDFDCPVNRPICPYCQQTLKPLVIEIDFIKYVINYLQQVWDILQELKNVLSSFVTILGFVVKCWMLNLWMSFNHTEDKHNLMLILLLFFGIISVILPSEILAS